MASVNGCYVKKYFVEAVSKVLRLCEKTFILPPTAPYDSHQAFTQPHSIYFCTIPAFEIIRSKGLIHAIGKNDEFKKNNTLPDPVHFARRRYRGNTVEKQEQRHGQAES